MTIVITLIAAAVVAALVAEVACRRHWRQLHHALADLHREEA